MSFVKRIVIDTSTLIGALLKPQSVPRQAFNRALATALFSVTLYLRANRKTKRLSLMQICPTQSADSNSHYGLAAVIPAWMPE